MQNAFVGVDRSQQVDFRQGRCICPIIWKLMVSCIFFFKSRLSMLNQFFLYQKTARRPYIFLPWREYPRKTEFIKNIWEWKNRDHLVGVKRISEIIREDSRMKVFFLKKRGDWMMFVAINARKIYPIFPRKKEITR